MARWVKVPWNEKLKFNDYINADEIVRVRFYKRGDHHINPFRKEEYTIVISYPNKEWHEFHFNEKEKFKSFLFDLTGIEYEE